MEQNSKKVSHLDPSHAVFNSVSKRLYGRNNSLISHITFKNKCAYF